MAMDIKAPLEKYAQVSGVRNCRLSPSKRASRCCWKGSVDYEFRTTVDRDLLDVEDLLEIGEAIRGARRYYLQKLNAYDAKGAALL